MRPSADSGRIDSPSTSESGKGAVRRLNAAGPLTGNLVRSGSLIAIAGWVDATSFVRWHGLFVSFMSGNSTSLAAGLERGEFAKELPIVVGVGAFVLGGVTGELLGQSVPVRRWTAVLSVEAAVLALAAGVTFGDGNSFSGACLLAFAMGFQNTCVSPNSAFTSALTYVTGALVHMSKGLAQALRGHSSWLAAAQYGCLWLSLMVGALGGATVAEHSAPAAILAAAILVCLAAVGLNPGPSNGPSPGNRCG